MSTLNAMLFRNQIGSLPHWRTLNIEAIFVESVVWRGERARWCGKRADLGGLWAGCKELGLMQWSTDLIARLEIG